MFQRNFVEEIKTHILCSKTLFFSENRAVYEKMSKNIVKRGRPQMTICRMRTACCIPKATNTHSQYVILTAFPLQQWSHERVSLLRYMYIAYLVMTEDVLCEVWNAAEESLVHQTY